MERRYRTCKLAKQALEAIMMPVNSTPHQSAASGKAGGRVNKPVCHRLCASRA